MFKYYILFIILNILDLVMTYFLIHPDLESNLMGQYIWRNYGFGGVIIMKTVLTIFPICVINRYSKSYLTKAKFAIIVANLIVLVPVTILAYIWSMV